MVPPPAASNAEHAQLRVLSVADFAFSSEDSVAVVSDAHKFVIPVPALGTQAEALVYPEGHPQQGAPIVDYKGRSVGEYGLVFFNEKDQTWQAVPADGTGVIIINEVLPAQATELDEKVNAETADLNTLTIKQLKEVLGYARLEMGLGDMYNSTREYVAKKLLPVATPAVHSAFVDSCYGLKKRDVEDIYQAIYISGAFKIKGVAATEQIFSEGGVIVEQDGDARGVQPEIFARTYRLANGQPIQSVEKDLCVTPSDGGRHS